MHSRKRNQEEQKLRRIARDQRALANEAAGIAEEKVRLKQGGVRGVCAWCVRGGCMVGAWWVVELGVFHDGKGSL